jgi:hypothetical protein
MNCSSSPVPSVATQSACVSPRVNSAEPWVRGRTPVSATIGRMVRVSRPSMRGAPLMMSPRRIEASSFLKAEPRFSSASSSSVSAALTASRAAAMALTRSCLSRMREGGAHLVLAGGLHLGVERRIVGRLEVEGLLRGVLGQVDDQVDHRLDAFMGELHRAQHLFLGQLVGFRFDHHHRVAWCRRRPGRAAARGSRAASACRRIRG